MGVMQWVRELHDSLHSGRRFDGEILLPPMPDFSALAGGLQGPPGPRGPRGPAPAGLTVSRFSTTLTPDFSGAGVGDDTDIGTIFTAEGFAYLVAGVAAVFPRELHFSYSTEYSARVQASYSEGTLTQSASGVSFLAGVTSGADLQHPQGAIFDVPKLRVAIRYVEETGRAFLVANKPIASTLTAITSLTLTGLIFA